MPVALDASVSMPTPPQEGAMAGQVRSRTHDMHQQDWRLLPDHEALEAGLSGAQLDCPALERRRDGAPRGEFAAVVVRSPDRLARHYAQP